jgi:hypothetical protein
MKVGRLRSEDVVVLFRRGNALLTPNAPLRRTAAASRVTTQLLQIMRVSSKDIVDHVSNDMILACVVKITLFQSP